LVNTTPREKDPIPIVHEAGWGPGTVWTGAKNLDPLTFRVLGSRYTN